MPSENRSLKSSGHETADTELSRRISALSPAKRELLERALRHTRAAAEDGLKRTGQDSAPLSFAQQRLWFLEKFDGSGTAYHLAGGVRLHGPLNRSALERALEIVVSRHESLRTRVTDVGGEPFQHVDAALHIALRHEDLEHLQGTTQADAFAAAMGRQYEEPFDLKKGPLARMTLVAFGPNDHVLLWTFHHMVSDGWSMAVFRRELAELYNALSQNRVVELAPLPVQYPDYALWQRRRLTPDALDRLLTYWLEKLDGAPALLALPTDRPSAGARSHRGTSQALELPAPVVDSLLALCHREGATLFMALLGAFKVLLARHSGQEDIVLGAPAAGRNDVALEGLIGFFVNTVVLRTDLSGNPTFRDLLHRVRTTAIDAFEHQDLPFEKLVEELRLERDLDHTPVFQAFFNMLAVPEPVPWSGLDVERVEPPHEESKFAVTLYVRPRPGHLELRLHYQTDLFSPARIATLLEQYVFLLEQIAAAPGRRIHDYSLVTTRAGSILPDPTLPIEASAQPLVVNQILAQARLVPERIAVSESGRAWTYDELIARARVLATSLRASGVERGHIVGVIAPPGFGLVSAMVGTLMAGGAFVTIDPDLPAARKRSMLDTAGARTVCLVGPPAGEEREWNADGVRTVLCTDLDLTLPSDRGAYIAGDDTPFPTVNGDDPAYVFFTSGSSGQPKAVLGRHNGLSHFLNWQRATFSVGPDDRVSQLIGLTFDPLLRDVFLPLTSGATLCVPSERDRLDVPGWLKREAVTIVHTTPTVMQSWLADASQRVDLPALRCLFIAGEPLGDALITTWRATVSGPAQLLNLYGPTETTMARCCYAVPREVTPGIQPVGYPLPDTQALVLGDDNVLCGIGEPGEVVLRTPYRTLGYRNLPDENARRFRPNPFRNDETDLVYFTGDRGHYTESGMLALTGRVDDEVKVRGVRIDPGEVNATLARHPDVRACFVVGGLDAHGQQQLVAYVVSRTDVDAHDLRGHLASQLPSVFVPAAFVFMDALPLLPNGKIDRRGLPAAPDPHAPANTFAPPATPIEEQIAGIWEEVLKQPRVGRLDDFFALGGHSLLAIQVLVRITARLNVDVPLRGFFETPTVAGLAALVQEMQPPSVVGIVERTDDLPLSFAEERLWFLDQLLSDRSAYNMPAAWRLRGVVDVPALTRALGAVVARQDMLRTRMVERDGRPIRTVDLPPFTALPVMDLSELEPADRDAQARTLADEEVARPFNLETDRLLRVLLLRLATDDHVLVVVLHHIGADAWSQRILRRDLSAAYSATLARSEPAWPHLPIQYADYAVWQRQSLAGEALDRQLEYWTRQLRGLTPLELPTDRARPPAMSQQGGHVTLTLAPTLAAALKTISQSEGATLFMTLLAAFQALLSRYSGQDDVAVGTPVTGRGRIEFENLIGFFVNTLVMRTTLSSDLPFLDLLARVRDGALDAYAHQDLPFERLVQALAPVRDLSRNPVVQVMFVLDSPAADGLVLEGLDVSRVPLARCTSRLDLTLEMQETPGGLRATWEYASDLFDAGTIERMARHFQCLLESVAADPRQPIGALRLLDDAERRQLIADWNDTTVADGQSQRCIHDVIAERAALAPESVAVVFEDRRLTYAELDARANRIAHHLVALGVGPEVLVGVCLEHSLDLVPALLGILKAGGAYVPLEPGYPPSRLAFMLEDSDARVLLTEQALLDRLPAYGGQVVCIDRDADEIAAEADIPPAGRATAGNLAYVMYTSGSSGKPKGVMVEHRAVCNHLAGTLEPYALGAHDSVLQTSALSFDPSVWQIFVPLMAGARLVLPSPAALGSPDALANLIRRHVVTALVMARALLAGIVNVQGFANCPALRRVSSGGEILDHDLAHRFSLQSRAQLVNVYGPTETTVYSLGWPYDESAARRTLPIGRPIANTTAYVLDRRGGPAPIGVPGELVIGGAGVARGYWKRPELTAERFVDDPFSQVPGARMYRTGDLARVLPDGNIDFLGRLDDQVKVRGFRVEPGEVAAVLAEHVGVKHAVVLAREDRPGDKSLVAYVVPRTAPAIDGTELRTFLRARLPEYMCPSAFVLIEALPLTPNGKVDRQALLARSTNPDEGRTAMEPPHTETERILSGIWANVLGLPQVGVTDNFFELGGHSLLATQVISRVRERFAMHIPLSVLFEAPTIRSFADYIAAFAADVLDPRASDDFEQFRI